MWNLEVATATEDHAGFHFCQPRTGSQRVDRRRLEKKHEIKVPKANIDGYYKFSEISFSNDLDFHELPSSFHELPISNRY